MNDPATLKSRAIKGVFWSATERLGPRAVQFVVSIILARLLTPAEFGLIGMLSVFMALGLVFLNSGFGSALIQKQNATKAHYNSVFFANILLSLVATGLLWVSAPWIAAFYNQPALIAPARGLSFNFLFAAIGLVQTTLLSKRMDFKTQAKVRLIAVTGSGVVGVSMALLNFGIWSLVAQSLSATLFNSLLLWVFNSWRPTRDFSMKALRELFGFSSRMLASGVLDTIFRNLYNVVIGKLFQPADLGYYTRANSLQQIPAQTLTGVIAKVTFPLFSEIQDDLDKMRNGFKKAIRAIALVNFPLMAGLMATAGPLVLTLLGEKWRPVIPYLQLLAIVGLFKPLSAINLNVLLAKGRSDLFFRLEIIKKTLVVLILLVTWRWGIQAIILGQIGSVIIAYGLNGYYNARLVDYPFRSQLRDLFPYFAAAAVMGGAVYLLNWLPISNMLALLILQVLVGTLVYVLLCRILRLPVFMDTWNLVSHKLQALLHNPSANR